MSKRHEQTFGGRGYIYCFDDVHTGMGEGSGSHAPDAWHPGLCSKGDFLVVSNSVVAKHCVQDASKAGVPKTGKKEKSI